MFFRQISQSLGCQAVKCQSSYLLAVRDCPLLPRKVPLFTKVFPQKEQQCLKISDSSTSMKFSSMDGKAKIS